MKRKVLFLIESFSGGGAEKVLTVFLKHFDYERYEVTVCPIVDTGVYRDEVKKYVTHYQPVIIYRGNIFSRWLSRIKNRLIYSVLPLSIVYRWFIPKGNDVEIAFCEGFVTKLLSQAKSRAKKIAWIHTDLKDNPWPIQLGVYGDVVEERKSYAVFDNIVCVSKTVESSFHTEYGLADRTCTIYNPIDIDDIRVKAGNKKSRNDGIFRIISIGRLAPPKGYDRLLTIVKRLHEEYPLIQLLILGEGEERPKMEEYIKENNMESFVSLPGFDTNPYRHLVNSDMFVCSSRAEGYSLVIAEAMVLGVPIISTYCSGPNELLHEGEYGLLVENSEDGIYNGLKQILDNPEIMEALSEKAKVRGCMFGLNEAKREIEKLLDE